jgi:hypothetical protein
MRNWKKVNNKYRTEGNLYLSFGFLKTWQKELGDLNVNKKGARYQYPDSLIRFCGTIKTIFGIGLRQIEGFAKSLYSLVPIPKIPSYTQISRRFNTLGLNIIDSLAEPKDGQVIAIDSTGIKLYQSGEWIREKHKKRRPFLKLHVAVNVKTKQAVAQILTEDSIDDLAMSDHLVEEAGTYAKVIKVIEDGAYDSYDNWISLDKKGIKPVIRLPKNAIEKGLNVRARAVREIKRIGLKKWKKKVKYGSRWLVEIWYSVFKRRFGEHCSARKPENIFQEILFKTILCNQMIA